MLHFKNKLFLRVLSGHGYLRRYLLTRTKLSLNNETLGDSLCYRRKMSA